MQIFRVYLQNSAIFSPARAFLIPFYCYSCIIFICFPASSSCRACTLLSFLLYIIIYIYKGASFRLQGLANLAGLHLVHLHLLSCFIILQGLHPAFFPAIHYYIYKGASFRLQGLADLAGLHLVHLHLLSCIIIILQE